MTAYQKLRLRVRFQACGLFAKTPQRVIITDSRELPVTAVGYSNNTWATNGHFDGSTLHSNFKSCLFRSEGKIEFLSQKNLNTVMISQTVAPCKPDKLCLFSPSVLLVLDWNLLVAKVQWLHCSTGYPKPLKGDKSFQAKYAIDMAYTRYAGQGFLVLSLGCEGLVCYNTDTGKEVWKVKTRGSGQKSLWARGVAADNRGRVYVCDHNNQSVELFSVENGRVMGAFLKKGEEGVGEPWLVCWHEAKSSLVVAHRRQTWVISVCVT